MSEFLPSIKVSKRGREIDSNWSGERALIKWVLKSRAEIKGCRPEGRRKLKPRKYWGWGIMDWLEGKVTVGFGRRCFES